MELHDRDPIASEATASNPKPKTPQNLGTISYEDFLQGIELILNLKSRSIWSKQMISKENPEIPGTIYLAFTQIIINHHHEAATAAEEAAAELINCTYHIVYSLSYEVPVLYFNYSFSSGKLLSIEQIGELILAKNVRNINKDLILQNISQQEHPLLHIPFYFLHPCHTNSLMEGLKIDKNELYLLSWLSIVSNLFGIPNNNCGRLEQLQFKSR